MRAARTAFSLATSILFLAGVARGEVPTLEPQEQVAFFSTSIEVRGNRVWVSDGSAAHLLRRRAGSHCDPTCWQVEQSVSPPSFELAFGQAITWRQNTLVISGGEPSGTFGGAYVYERQNGAFVFRQHLHENLPLFGRAHALAGDYMVVNSHFVFSTLPVGPYLYHRTPSGLWESLGLLANSVQQPGNFDQYGINVAMTRRNILVGADEGGYVAAFHKRDGVWEERQILQPLGDAGGFGRGIAIRGKTAVIGAYLPGVVYVFELRDGAWQQLQMLERWDDSQVGFFGHDVAYDGKRIAAMDREAIYVFERRRGVWLPKAKLVNSGTFRDDGPFDKLQFEGRFLYAISSTGVWRYDLSGLEGG
jgi:hypothetical protein